MGTDIIGEIKPKPKISRSKKRYQDFKDADWFSGTFAEWLNIKPKKEQRCVCVYGKELVLILVR